MKLGTRKSDPAEPWSVSSRWGTLLPRPRGYYWLTQARSPWDGSPVDVIAPDGGDAGPVRGLGPTIHALTTPDGGLVAETVQGLDGASPVTRQERVSATAAWLGPVDPGVGWIGAVNARGDLLLLRDRAAAIPSYRWADADLEPLTGWFDAYPRSPVAPRWFPLPDGTLVALHGVGTYAFRDRVEGIEKNNGITRLRTKGGLEAGYDLLVYVPPIRPPRVIAESGLADGSGWVPVDRATMETRFPGVHAVWDVTLIPLTVGKPLPRAGVFAHAQAEVVAQNVARSLGGKGHPTRFDGHGACFIETGGGKAGYGAGNFYGEPRPAVKVRSPSRLWHAGKVLLEKQILWQWL